MGRTWPKYFETATLKTRLFWRNLSINIYRVDKHLKKFAWAFPWKQMHYLFRFSNAKPNNFGNLYDENRRQKSQNVTVVLLQYH